MDKSSIKWLQNVGIFPPHGKSSDVGREMPDSRARLAAKATPGRGMNATFPEARLAKDALMFRLMVADVDSPSYFVATAAVKLGFFRQEGVDVEFVAEYGAKHGPEKLRDGTVHFFGGPAF